MKTTYLAIFGADPKTFHRFKETLAEKQTPEEREEADRIAEAMFKNPKSIDQTDFDKVFAPKNGKERLIGMFENKLKFFVDQMLESHEDKDDIAWSVQDIVTSDEFFGELNPDTSLPFKNRLDIHRLPERVLLPNGTWSTDELENTLERYRKEYLYVFFFIDN